MDDNIKRAIDTLGAEFSSLDLTFHKMDGVKPDDVTSYWPGEDNEDVMMCVFKGRHIHEPFHRQDFFFLNYAYHQSYNALSEKRGNLITVNENECYIGQPYSGYALRGESASDIVIIGVLIRRDIFFREYLPLVYADSGLFRFFIEPSSNRFAESFIHLDLSGRPAARTILELMVCEYADRGDDTQIVLKALMQALMLEIARSHRQIKAAANDGDVSERMLEYIDEHSDSVTLKSLAAHFSYHPNYVSALLSKKTGQRFSDIVLRSKMERAQALIANTSLSLEDISAMLGYRDHSSFYKAYKSYYGKTPRSA